MNRRRNLLIALALAVLVLCAMDVAEQLAVARLDAAKREARP